VLPDVLGIRAVDQIPSRISLAEKSEVARLAPHVLRVAESGDAVAREIIVAAALDLALHVDALMERLGPWSEPPVVVLHGGFARDPIFAPHVAAVLRGRPRSVRLAEPAADPVTGALACARALGAKDG
jgi:N-acetylglucosamine kinase-like BadF-type ATPase